MSAILSAGALRSPWLRWPAVIGGTNGDAALRALANEAYFAAGVTLPGVQLSAPVAISAGGFQVSRSLPGATLAVEATLDGGEVVIAFRFGPLTLDLPAALVAGAIRLGQSLPGQIIPAPVALVRGIVRAGMAVPGQQAGVGASLVRGGIGLGQSLPGAVLATPVALRAGELRVNALFIIPGAVLTIPLSISPGDFALASVVQIEPVMLTLTGGVLSWQDVPIYATKYEGWNVIKGMARRAVHDVFAVDAIYTPNQVNGVPKAIKVRWHVRGNKLLGDLQGQGYGEIISAVDRMVFNTEQLAVVGVTKLGRGDRVTIPGLNGATFMLDALDPSDGPVTQTWEVVRA